MAKGMNKNGHDAGLLQQLWELVKEQEIRIRTLEKLAGIDSGVHTEGSENPPPPPPNPPH